MSSPQKTETITHNPIQEAQKHKLSQTHLQNIENASLDSNVPEPPLESFSLFGGSHKYFVDGITFITNDSNPEKIAAQLVAPRNKNCQYLINFGTKNSQKLYKKQNSILFRRKK